MPRERGKPKCGPSYYSFLARCTFLAPSCASSPYLCSTFSLSPSTVHNWDENDWGLVFVEEEFPLVLPQLTVESSEAAHVAAQILLVPSTQARGDSPTQVPEENWSFPVLEEVTPMVVEEAVLEAACPDTVVTHNGEVISELTPRQGFSKEQLQLIFELRQDVADQLYRQDILSRRLDVFFDSFSSDPVKRRFPTCCHPFTFTLAWPHPPPGNGHQDASGV
jgi:hypothetical protein